MVDYATFSSLRLRQLFSREALELAPFYSEVKPDGHGFDIEYLGGVWDQELIDGVTLWFPKADGSKVGIVEVKAGPHVDGVAVEGRPGPDMGPNPAWVANANRVLEALELPRIGAVEEAVRSQAAGQIWSHPIPDSVAPGTVHVPRQAYNPQWARSSLFFATKGPAPYHIEATVHASQGLLKLEIRRPDLIRANDFEGEDGYDSFLSCLYDAWPDEED
jgi:hypothetical protein